MFYCLDVFGLVNVYKVVFIFSPVNKLILVNKPIKVTFTQINKLFNRILRIILGFRGLQYDT